LYEVVVLRQVTAEYCYLKCDTLESGRTFKTFWGTCGIFRTGKYFFSLKRRAKVFSETPVNLKDATWCFLTEGRIVYGFSVNLVTLLAFLVGKNVTTSEQ